MSSLQRWTLVSALAVAAGWVGCSGTIGGDDGAAPPSVPPATEMGAGPSGVRRLTVFEFDATLLDLLGDDTRPGLPALPEDPTEPFDNDMTKQNPSRVGIDAYETIATDVSTRLLDDAPRLAEVLGCTPGGPGDAACMRHFVERFGRRALRRPLTDVQREDFMTLATDWATQESDFYAGVDVVVRAMLQSSQFLYRVEVGQEVPGQPGLFALDAYEVASRMSYLIWGSMPDDILLDEAGKGTLGAAAGRRAAAARMLEDPRALRQVDRFHAMWLGYDRMPLPPNLTSAMRAETNALIERVVFDDRASWLNLFTSDETFVDAALAAHYGLTAPADPAGGWVPFGAGGRLGLLGQGAFLSAASNPGDTSPTKRGILIRNRLMCQTILPPPPGVAVDVAPGSATQDCKWDAYLASRNQGADCAACHARTDLVGFGLENYDMQGRFRNHDDGKPQCAIEGSGTFVETGETFNGPGGLATMLVDSGLLGACVVQHLMQFTVGRELTGSDDVLVSLLAETFEESDHHFAGLVTAIVGADAFGFRLALPANN